MSFLDDEIIKPLHDLQYEFFWFVPKLLTNMTYNLNYRNK